MASRAPVDSRHTILVGRALTKIRRRVEAHRLRPAALAGRPNICITLPATQWDALLNEIDR